MDPSSPLSPIETQDRLPLSKGASLQSPTVNPQPTQEGASPLPVLLVSRGLFHPHLFARLACERLLARIPGVSLSFAPSLDGIAHRDLSLVRAIVLYFHEKTLALTDLESLRAYVRAGGGLVAVHSAAASYKGQPAYADLLGGRFAVHGPVGRFTVRPAPGLSLPGAPLQPFALFDERYRHEILTAVTVDYHSENADSPEPFAWRRAYGAGRVFYLAAGHTLSGLSHPSIRSILAAGLRWAVEGTS